MDRLIISIRHIVGTNIQQKDITIDVDDPPSDETLVGLMSQVFEDVQEVLAITWPEEYPFPKEL